MKIQAITGIVCLVWLLTSAAAESHVYYVANQGSDTAAGTSPDTPWQSLGKVNATHFEPGDKIFFRRGDTWRGQLRACSGSNSGCVTYGAYGEGAKPLLLGSVKRNHPEDWRHENENVWTTTGPRVSGDDVLAGKTWDLYCENGAVADAAGFSVHCSHGGQHNSDIQRYASPFQIDSGKMYRLTFRAKSDKPFRLSAPVVMKAGRPWTRYASASRPASIAIAAEANRFEIFYSAFSTADDARLTFFLGGALPESATFQIDELALVECDADSILSYDVGNIIFNKEAVCGVKVWKESGLRGQGQFWYDEARHVVKMYSTACPAAFYSDIECALTAHIIDESNASYVTYENMALKYGAAHGIGGGGTHHITVRDSDIGFIGGGDQMGGGKTVRYGNGIEFWGAAHDNLVERCRLWEIYDAALTNQSGGPNTSQYNITYRLNTIWNSEYSFEYWNRPENSVTHHIHFEHNTCVNAGHGWSHAQRPDPSGRHLCFYTSPAPAHDFFIRDNIFFEATGNAFYAPTWPREAINALEIDHNCWFQASGDMIAFKGGAYPMARFTEYQAQWGKDTCSAAAAPKFVDAANHDFRLVADSPCDDCGAMVGEK